METFSSIRTVPSIASPFPPSNESHNRRYLLYPSTADGVVITCGDLERLKDGEMLNDSIIDFYFKYLDLEIIPKWKIPRKFYFYSSFFIRKLEIDGKDRKSYLKWTKNVDLFGMDFLFLPINAHLHWSLCIIANPRLIFKNMMEEEGKREKEEEGGKKMIEEKGGREEGEGVCEIYFLDSLGKKGGNYFRRFGKERERECLVSELRKEKRERDSV